MGLICLLSSFLAGCSYDLGQSGQQSSGNDAPGNNLPLGPEDSASSDKTSSNGNVLERKITLTLNANGGTVDQTSFSLEYGKPFSLPVPSKLGYVFSGWAYNGTKVTDSSGNGLSSLSISQDATLTADYAVRNITLNFYHLDQKLTSKTYNIEMDLYATLEGKIDALADPLWGWYKDKEMTQFVNSYEDLEIDANNNANIYSKKAEGFTVEGTTLVNADRTIVKGGIDLGHLFIGGLRATGIGTNGSGFVGFRECNGLTSVIIPDSVKVIGSHSFAFCSALVSVRLPKTISVIDVGTFSSCTSLTSIEIPEGVEKIGVSAFQNCSSLVDVKLPSSLISIGSTAFGNCPFSSIEIPKNVQAIGGWQAFMGCKNLVSITIPDGVKDIPLSTFAGCTSLQSVTIPQSVTSIGQTAFSGCSSLPSITISSSVTRVQRNAFANCSILKIHVDLPEPANGVPDGWESNWNGGCPVTWKK